MRVGMFTASRISELLAGGSGKTKQSYIYDIACEVVGVKKEISTAPMIHGINTEQSAFDFGVLPLFPNAILKSDQFVKINDNLGCSTDVEFTDSNRVLDIKCPTIRGFFKHKEKPTKQYYDQIQTQLLSTGGDVGYLFYWLSKPVTWENGDEWEEYPFENFDDNFFIHEIQKDEERQEHILKAVEENAPIRNEMIEILLNAKEVDFKEFFYLNSKKYLPPLKESQNILKETNIVKFENEFYSVK